MTDPASATPSLLRLPRFHSSAPFLPLHSFSDTLLCIFSAAANWRGGGGGRNWECRHLSIIHSAPASRHQLPLQCLLPPTSAVNLCDLDFKALVFHSHCSLWLSFLHNPFDKLRDHCEDAESIRRSSDRSGVAPGTAGHRCVTSHSTVCYTATRGNAAQTQGRADLPALL